MKAIPILAVLCLALPVAAFAQTNMPRVDQRAAHQESRIEQGSASGRLTPHEATRLERGQQHVNNMETRARSDGVVTRQERARIHHEQEVQSRQIHHEKHDRQHDFNHDGRRDPHRGHG